MYQHTRLNVPLHEHFIGDLVCIWNSEFEIQLICLPDHFCDSVKDKQMNYQHKNVSIKWMSVECVNKSVRLQVETKNSQMKQRI